MTPLLTPLSPDAFLLAVGVVADFVVGDPVYAWHPVRLIGRTLTWIEGHLRNAGSDGYGGGILLFVGLATISLGVATAILFAASAASMTLSRVFMCFFFTVCWPSATSSSTSGGSRLRSAPATCPALVVRSARSLAGIRTRWMARPAGERPLKA